MLFYHADPAKAAGAFSRAFLQRSIFRAGMAGLVLSCTSMMPTSAQIVEHTGIKQQASSPSLSLLLKKANQGDAVSQRNLGFLYATGQGVRKDYSEATRWYQKAADQGDSEAQNKI